jgi:glycosyltransferase involved in cell wall biosynthesis
LKVFASEDSTACGYYRIRMPFDEMKKHGLDVDYVHLKARVPDGAIYVGQRVGYPGVRLSWLTLFRHHSLVWETDDDLWCIDPTNERASKVYTPELLAETEQIVRLSHMVTVSTEPLAEAMSKFNSNVVVLPNHIDGAMLDIERPRRDRLTVGWAGGDSHKKDLAMVAPKLRRFLSRNPDVDFHVIGQDYLHENKIPGRWTPWSKELFDYYRTIDFDIGIAPLIPSRFNRSKSAIKALEYAALGIPVIASAEAPYTPFVVDGVTGFLVRYEHEWEARLRDLTNDAGMREEMGRNAKEHARKWTIQTGWKLWADAYSTLA